MRSTSGRAGWTSSRPRKTRRSSRYARADRARWVADPQWLL